MEEYLVFGEGILSDIKNKEQVGLFCGKYGYRIIQAGFDPMPQGGKWIFFDRNAEVVQKMKEENQRAFLIGDGADEYTLTRALQEISGRKEVGKSPHTLLNGHAIPKNETQPLLQKESDGCCLIL